MFLVRKENAYLTLHELSAETAHNAPTCTQDGLESQFGGYLWVVTLRILQKLAINAQKNYRVKQLSWNALKMKPITHSTHSTWTWQLMRVDNSSFSSINFQVFHMSHNAENMQKWNKSLIAFFHTTQATVHLSLSTVTEVPNKFNDVCKRWSIKHIKSSPHYPQSNRVAELANGVEVYSTFDSSNVACKLSFHSNFWPFFSRCLNCASVSERSSEKLHI